MAITRRQLLQSTTFAALTPALGATAALSITSPAQAQGQAQAATEPAWRHALSLFGDIKYPEGFKRFDYVNPDAPKTGVVRMFELGTFDNFNIVVSGLKGIACRCRRADGREADNGLNGRGGDRVWPAR